MPHTRTEHPREVFQDSTLRLLGGRSGALILDLPKKVRKKQASFLNWGPKSFAQLQFKPFLLFSASVPPSSLDESNKGDVALRDGCCLWSQRSLLARQASG